jgi:tetratricopeptide (TPR) repeat protein
MAIPIMSRFGNLEFEGRHEDESETQSSTRGEHHYLAEAQTAYAAGDFEKALRSFARVLEFNPNNTAAWTGQVRVLIELEEFREAKLWADKALERFPRQPELLAAKAVALGRMGETDVALVFSDASTAEPGETPYIWLARGDVLLARGEKTAEFCFAKALALAAHDWFVHWLAARICFFYQKLTLAFKYVQQALALDPTHGSIWLQLGYCQQGLGLIGPAEVSFRRARELNPGQHGADAALRSLAAVGLGARLRGAWRRLFSA